MIPGYSLTRVRNFPVVTRGIHTFINSGIRNLVLVDIILKLMHVQLYVNYGQ